ncbi:MAG: PIN domain-containing protein [Terriglobales bacterium]
MSARAFVDSNVILYIYDDRWPDKSRRGRLLLAELMNAQRGVISTQVLQECFAVATRKLGISPLEAKEFLLTLSSMPVIQITPELIYDAIDGVMLYRLSFWDSLIVSAAALARCATLYTEDMQHGQIIRGVRICNPFI